MNTITKNIVMGYFEANSKRFEGRLVEQGFANGVPYAIYQRGFDASDPEIADQMSYWLMTNDSYLCGYVAVPRLNEYVVKSSEDVFSEDGEITFQEDVAELTLLGFHMIDHDTPLELGTARHYVQRIADEFGHREPDELPMLQPPPPPTLEEIMYRDLSGVVKHLNARTIESHGRPDRYFYTEIVRLVLKQDGKKYRQHYKVATNSYWMFDALRSEVVMWEFVSETEE